MGGISASSLPCLALQAKPLAGSGEEPAEALRDVLHLINLHREVSSPRPILHREGERCERWRNSGAWDSGDSPSAQTILSLLSAPGSAPQAHAVSVLLPSGSVSGQDVRG